jgi:hypothetical protein
MNDEILQNMHEEFPEVLRHREQKIFSYLERGNTPRAVHTPRKDPL